MWKGELRVKPPAGLTLKPGQPAPRMNADKETMSFYPGDIVGIGDEADRSYLLTDFTDLLTTYYLLTYLLTLLTYLLLTTCYLLLTRS